MDLITLLSSRGVLDSNQARLIRQRQGALGGAVADHLLEMGLVSYSVLQNALAESMGYPPLDGVELDLADRYVRRFLSSKIAHRYRVAPLCLVGRRLLLVTSDPSKAEALFVSLHRAHQVQPELRVAAPFLVDSILAWLYGSQLNEMTQNLCFRLTPRFYRSPLPSQSVPVNESENQITQVNNRPVVSGLGQLMEQLRACEDVGTWLDELRMNLASWSPRAEVSRHRPRGLRNQDFLAAIPNAERPLLWIYSQGSGRRLDRVRRKRLESLVRLLQPDFHRFMVLGKA